MNLFFLAVFLLAPGLVMAQWSQADYMAGRCVAVLAGGVDLSTATTALAAKAAAGANGDITAHTIPVTHTSTTTFKPLSVSSQAYVVDFSSANGTRVAGITANGLIALGSLSVAQLLGTVCGLPCTAYCNNCSPKKMVISTGSAAGNFADAVGGAFK